MKEVKTKTWTQWLSARLRATNSPYATFYHSGLETQFQPTDDEKMIEPWFDKPFTLRIPKDGDVQPLDNDGRVAYAPCLIACAGTSWWNWRDGLTEACYFDFDYGHGPKGLDEAGIAKVDAWAGRLPYVMNCASKSGKGRHWLVKLTTPLPAKIRGEHSRNCRAVKDQVSKDLGFEIGNYVCSFGGIQYIYSARVAI